MDASDCQTAIEVLDLYLDNELLVETSQSVLSHLASCRDCTAELQNRIELRRLLKATSSYDDDSDSGREDWLRRKIEAALHKDRRRRVAANIRWGVLAASLIVILGSTYWRIKNTPKPVNSAAVTMAAWSPDAVNTSMNQDAIANHQACALTYPANWTYDRARIVRELTPHFVPLVDAVGRYHGPYQLIEGHICSYQQRQYAHLIFRGNGHTVSIFIEHHDPFGKLQSSPSEIDQASYSAYQLASVDTGINRIYLVSDLSTAENINLAKQLFPRTLTFVQKMES